MNRKRAFTTWNVQGRNSGHGFVYPQGNAVFHPRGEQHVMHASSIAYVLDLDCVWSFDWIPTRDIYYGNPDSN